MKKIYKLLLFTTLLCFVSCTIDNEVERESNSDMNYEESLETSFYTTKSSGDGVWDVLGYGYDIKGDFANPNYAKANILKLELLDNDNRLTEHLVNTTESIVVADYNATEYKKEIASKINLGGSGFFGLFDASLTGKFENTIIQNSSYAFGSSDYIVTKKKLSIDGDANEIAQYLTINFREDADQMSPKDFTDIYGSHLIKTAYLGAKLNLIFTGSSSLSSSTKTIEAGLSVSFIAGKVFGLTGNSSYNPTYSYSGKFNSARMYSKTIGGSTIINVPSLDITNPTQLPTIDISNWLNSITADNSLLINFDNTSLISNYELINDQVVSNEIKDYLKTGVNYSAPDNVLLSTNFGDITFSPGDMAVYYKSNFSRVLIMKTRRGRWIEIADVNFYNSLNGNYTTSIKNNLLTYPATLPIIQQSFINENFEKLKENSYISLAINNENGKKYMIYQNGYEKRAYLIKNDLVAQKYKIVYGLPTIPIQDLNNFSIKVL